MWLKESALLVLMVGGSFAEGRSDQSAGGAAAAKSVPRAAHDKASEPDRKVKEAEAAQSDFLSRFISNIQSIGRTREGLNAAKIFYEAQKKFYGEESPQAALAMTGLGYSYSAQADFLSARPLLEKAVTINRKLFPLGKPIPGHRFLAVSLEVLGLLDENQGDYVNAEVRFQEALGLRRRLRGENDIDTASTLQNLGELYQIIGDPARAEPLIKQAFEIRKSALGTDHPETARNLNSLALLYASIGEYAKAEEFARRACDTWKKALGKNRQETAFGLFNLAGIYQSMGDYAKAEPLYCQSLEISKTTLGKKHPFTATALASLAGLYRALGDHARADPLDQQALEICRQVLGEKHPTTAASLSNVAQRYEVKGDYANAEPLLRQALQIDKEVLGEKHPSTAAGLHNLAFLYELQGDYARAEPLYRKALEVRKQALGDNHPLTVQSLNNLAFLYQMMGKSARAESMCREALAICEQHLSDYMHVQSERQQLALARLLRSNFDVYLTITSQVPVSAANVYQHVLGWKGAVFMRQFALLSLRRRPDLQPRFHELDSVSARLSNLVLRGPDGLVPAAWKREVNDLSDKKERLEGELARAGEELRQQQALSAAKLQEALPEQVTLVDFLEYTHYSPPVGGKGLPSRDNRLVAFVVRKDRPVRRIELGGVQSLAAAADDWRRAILRGGGGPDEIKAWQNDPAHKPPQQILKELLWNPLQDSVAGSQTVLISPDGLLSQIPLGALPGKSTGSFLLEEETLAIVPVPQLLPLLLGAPKTCTEHVKATANDDEQSLLTLGDVSYGSRPGKAEAVFVTSRSAVRGSRGGLFFPTLKHSRSEIATIRSSFETYFSHGKVHVLSGENATEAMFRREAPNYDWLHLATHGFFAPPELAPVLAASFDDNEHGSSVFSRLGIWVTQPGLMSGIALSGSNTRAKADEDDGILTAVEVAGLDLRRAQLVVLSACETGLGAVAGGEGVLGLQRAFQLAGAKTCVTSLWKVDDAATQVLMTEFYKNLWEKRLGRLQSLRAAQLAMLRQYDPKEQKLRGLDLAEDDTMRPKRGSPRYWSAFVLSGDWR
jgi:CHAT domain-containing protein/tetratricopeptide (TPR) repeat protein